MATAHPLATESTSAPADFSDWTELKAQQARDRMKTLDLFDTGSEIYRLQACVCTFQPGHATGWDSEGVNYSTSMFSCNDVQ